MVHGVPHRVYSMERAWGARASLYLTLWSDPDMGKMRNCAKARNWPFFPVWSSHFWLWWICWGRYLFFSPVKSKHGGPRTGQYQCSASKWGLLCVVFLFWARITIRNSQTHWELAMTVFDIHRNWNRDRVCYSLSHSFTPAGSPNDSPSADRGAGWHCTAAGFGTGRSVRLYLDKYSSLTYQQSFR